jgi:hypothetical protein
MTLHDYLREFDTATIAGGVRLLWRLMDEGADFESAREHANWFMRERFKAKARIEQAARVLGGQPAVINDTVH